MGLDLMAGRETGPRPDDPGPQWSYGGFEQFRQKLAAHVGLSLDDMAGYGGETSWDTVGSPLRHLLDHSDCDGELSPQKAAELAPALQQALFALARDHDYGGAYDHDIRAGRELVELLARCASENIPVWFR